MSIVQLSDPRGTRYTREQKEEAYLLWRTGAGRSLRKVAELTGISAGTLSNWARDEDWATRAQRDDAETAKLLQSCIGSVIIEQALKSLDTVIHLRDDAATPPKVRLDAAVFMAGLAGVAELHRGGIQVLPDPTLPHLTSADIEAMTDEERNILRWRD